MKRFLSLLALLAMPAQPAAKTAFACRLNAFSAAQRTEHAALARELFPAVEETHELPGGYAFRLAAGRWTDVARWVDLERRCCPFFSFELTASPDSGPVWLRITGRPGVKAFMKEEFGLPR